jgi:hypothetical protein
MSNPELPGPNDPHPGGQVVNLDNDGFEELIPKTTIDHLLSEEERKQAAEERREFEAVGRSMALTEGSLYSVFYESARERIASGVSVHEIRQEMLVLAKLVDEEFASALCEAYEDVLAGRPPRFSSPF